MSLYLLDKKNKVIALAIHPKAVWYDMITEFVGEQKQ
jgi:hypothetical protein